MSASSKNYPGNKPISFHNYYRQKRERILNLPNFTNFLQVIWPGASSSLWAGFMTNGSQNEDTACSSDPPAFHEIGWFGIESGPTDRPSKTGANCNLDPVPKTARQNNNWLQFHNHPKVIEVLGRPACMRPNCWKGDSGLADQLAVGLVSMRYGQYESIKRNLPESIRPQNPNSLWATALTFMTWSAGAGGASNAIRPFANALASVPEDQRWDAFRRLVAEAILAGRMTPGRASHNNPIYSINRTQQKIAAGSETYEENTIDDIIARACANNSPGINRSISPANLTVSSTSFPSPQSPSGPIQQTEEVPVTQDLTTTESNNIKDLTGQSGYQDNFSENIDLIKDRNDAVIIESEQSPLERLRNLETGEKIVFSIGAIAGVGILGFLGYKLYQKYKKE